MRSRNGKSYEIHVAQRLASLGYTVRVIGKTADYGADLIVYTRQGAVVVQCKHYSKPVGVKAVQEVTAAWQFYGAIGAAVATNSTFTANAKKLAARCKVELIERF